MGKKRRQKKLERKLAEEARKLTWPKVLKLMVKTFLLVLALSLLLSVGLAAGLAWLRTHPAQLAVYGIGYLLAYRWLMSDFLPPRSLTKPKK